MSDRPEDQNPALPDPNGPPPDVENEHLESASGKFFDKHFPHLKNAVDSKVFLDQLHQGIDSASDYLEGILGKPLPKEAKDDLKPLVLEVRNAARKNAEGLKAVQERIDRQEKQYSALLSNLQRHSDARTADLEKMLAEALVLLRSVHAETTGQTAPQVTRPLYQGEQFSKLLDLSNRINVESQKPSVAQALPAGASGTLPPLGPKIAEDVRTRVPNIDQVMSGSLAGILHQANATPGLAGEAIHQGTRIGAYAINPGVGLLVDLLGGGRNVLGRGANFLANYRAHRTLDEYEAQREGREPDTGAAYSVFRSLMGGDPYRSSPHNRFNVRTRARDLQRARADEERYERDRKRREKEDGTRVRAEAPTAGTVASQQEDRPETIQASSRSDRVQGTVSAAPASPPPRVETRIEASPWTQTSAAQDQLQQQADQPQRLRDPNKYMPLRDTYRSPIQPTSDNLHQSKGFRRESTHRASRASHHQPKGLHKTTHRASHANFHQPEGLTHEAIHHGIRIGAYAINPAAGLLMDLTGGSHNLIRRASNFATNYRGQRALDEFEGREPSFGRNALSAFLGGDPHSSSSIRNPFSLHYREADLRRRYQEQERQDRERKNAERTVQGTAGAARRAPSPQPGSPPQTAQSQPITRPVGVSAPTQAFLDAARATPQTSAPDAVQETPSGQQQGFWDGVRGSDASELRRVSNLLMAASAQREAGDLPTPEDFDRFTQEYAARTRISPNKRAPNRSDDRVTAEKERRIHEEETSRHADQEQQQLENEHRAGSTLLGKLPSSIVPVPPPRQTSEIVKADRVSGERATAINLNELARWGDFQQQLKDHGLDPRQAANYWEEYKKSRPDTVESEDPNAGASTRRGGRRDRNVKQDSAEASAYYKQSLVFFERIIQTLARIEANTKPSGQQSTSAPVSSSPGPSQFLNQGESLTAGVSRPLTRTSVPATLGVDGRPLNRVQSEVTDLRDATRRMSQERIGFQEALPREDATQATQGTAAPSALRDTVRTQLAHTAGDVETIPERTEREIKTDEVKSEEYYTKSLHVLDEILEELKKLTGDDGQGKGIGDKEEGKGGFLKKLIEGGVELAVGRRLGRMLMGGAGKARGGLRNLFKKGAGAAAGEEVAELGEDLAGAVPGETPRAATPPKTTSPRTSVSVTEGPSPTAASPWGAAPTTEVPPQEAPGFLRGFSGAVTNFGRAAGAIGTRAAAPLTFFSTLLDPTSTQPQSADNTKGMSVISQEEAMRQFQAGHPAPPPPAAKPAEKTTPEAVNKSDSTPGTGVLSWLSGLIGISSAHAAETKPPTVQSTPPATSEAVPQTVTPPATSEAVPQTVTPSPGQSSSSASPGSTGSAVSSAAIGTIPGAGFIPGLGELGALNALGSTASDLYKAGPDIGKRTARGMTEQQFDDWTQQAAQTSGLVRKPALSGPGREPIPLAGATMAGVSSSSPYAATPTVTGTVQPTLGGSTAITTSASAPVAETAPPQPADTTTNTTGLQDKKVKEEKDDNQSKLDQLTNMVSTLSGFAPGFTELQAVGNILGELRKRGPEVGKQAARGMTSKQFDDWTTQIAKDHGLVRKPALSGPGREPMAPGTPASPPSASAPYVQEERGTSGQRRSTSGDTSQTVRDASITSPAARAFLDTVADKESGGQYNVSYGGGHFQDYSAHPGSSSVITSGPNQGRTSSAAGRYQFTQSTWQEASKALGLKDFSPESQDKAAWWLAQRDYNTQTHRDLSGDINSTDPQVRANIASTLKKTWTSLPGGIEAGGNLADFNTRFDQHLKQEAAANEDRKDGQGQVTASLEGPRAPGSAADILRQRSERPADLPAGVQAASADPGFVPTISRSSGATSQSAGSFQAPLGAAHAMSSGGYPQVMSPMAQGIGGAISGVFGNILGQGAGVASRLMSGMMARSVDSLPQAIRPFAGSMMDSAQRDTGLFPSRIAGEVSGEVGNLIGMATGHPQAPLRTGSPMAGGFPGLTMPSPQGIMGMIGGMVGGVLNRGAGMLSQTVSGLVGRGTGHLPSMLRPMAGSAVSSVEHGIGGAISGAVQGTINTVMGYSPRRVGESTWHTLDPRAASGDPERGRGPTHVPTRAEAERVQRNIEHGMGLRHTPTHAEAEHVAANINRGMGLDRAAVPSISGRSAPAPGRMDTTSPGVPTTPPTANEASSMSMISAISQGAGSGQNGGQSGDAGLTGASPALSGSAASLMDMSTAFAPDETQLFALQRLG